MSSKNKIRDLQTDVCNFEIYLVEPDMDDEFKLPYVLAIPQNVKNGSKIVVESNNRERDNHERDIDYTTEYGRNFLIENAINEVIGNKTNFGRIEFVKNLRAPFIMPIIPSVNKGIPYFQQLSKECLTINDTKSVFYRIDWQLCKMIEDTKKILLERKISVADKIFLNGYSTSGVFAQRFAFLHPEIVDTILVGGAGGSVPMPLDCKYSDSLEYPLGTKDYIEITGNSFDLDNYRKINFQYYLAEYEEIRKSNDGKNEFGFQASMHDMSYMSRSVPENVGKKLRKFLGINLWKRFIKQISEYEKHGYKIKAEIYKNKIHDECFIPINDFEKIYNGEEFSQTSEDVKKDKRRRVWNDIKFQINWIKGRLKKKLPEVKNNNVSKYSNYVELIDDIDLGRKIEKAVNIRGLDKKIEELRKKYESKLSFNEDIYDYPLQTVLEQKQTIELAQRFFSSIDTTIGRKVNDILVGKTKNVDGQFIDLQLYPFNENLKYYQTRYDTNSKNYGIRRTQAMAEMPRKDSNDIMIYVPLRGDLRDLYGLVHELSHFLDTKSGDTDTRKVLGEVVPQCMERLLDDFLISLPNQDKVKIGIIDSNLKRDIQDRKITTFLSRYNCIKNFNRNEGNRVKNSRYMLAQLYQAQFIKSDSNERKEKIMSFIKNIEQDNFLVANESFRIKNG